MSTKFHIFNHEKDLHTYNPGDLIFDEDYPGDAMYAVLEGEVELRKHERLLEVVSEGGIFGEMALVDRKPRNATARAKTACKIAKVDESRFLFLVQHNPYFALQVMQVMADRIRAMAREMTE